jgi:hypothetical protein
MDIEKRSIKNKDNVRQIIIRRHVDDDRVRYLDRLRNFIFAAGGKRQNDNYNVLRVFFRLLTSLLMPVPTDK